MSARARRRLERCRLVLLVAALAIVAWTAGAAAQEYVRFAGVVRWIAGQTLTLELDTPSAPPSYVISGQYLLPVPGPPQTLYVDLSGLPQTAYAFMRLGERLSVIGVLSDDRRQLTATSLIRGRGQSAP